MVCHSMTATLETSRLYSPRLAAAKAFKDKTSKIGWDKAQQFIDKQELPASWNKEQLFNGFDIDSDEV